MSAFQSEPWRRPPRFLVRAHTRHNPDGSTVRIPARIIGGVEDNHVHFHHPGTSNHMRGAAMDLPLRDFRTLTTQRKLYENWVGRSPDTRRALRGLPHSDVMALIRCAPLDAKLVAWGGRKGDVQVGSSINSSFRRRLPVQAALIDMGREFDAIWLA